MCDAWITAFSATAIFLLDRPRVGSLESLEFLVAMKRTVSPVCNIIMSARALSLMPSRCGLSCVL